MKRININGHRWTITLACQDEIQNVYFLGHGRRCGTLDGICDYSKRRILIHEGLSSDNRKRTLRHELIHAFVPSLGEREVVNLDKAIEKAGELV
jgi:hypothetical protein